MRGVGVKYRPVVVLLLAGLSFSVALAGTALLSGELSGLLEQWEVAPHSRWVWLNAGAIAGFALLLVLLTLLSTALFAGVRGIPGFLGLTRTGAGVTGMSLFMVATPFLAYLGLQLRSVLFSEGSDRLRTFDRLLSESTGGGLVALVLVLAVGVPFGEELLFRGLLMRGLRVRLSPVFTVAVVSLAFALAHLDLQHSIAILPVSLWLTVVAYRTDSLWPAILGHSFNNLVAGLLVSWGAASSEHLASWVHALAWCLAFPSFALAVGLILGGPKQTGAASVRSTDDQNAR